MALTFPELPQMFINLKRNATILKPDQTRVLLRPLDLKDHQRIGKIIGRIMLLSEDQVDSLLNQVSAEFSQRHQQIHKIFLERFEQIRGLVGINKAFSEKRKLLIGSYFLAEYSLESAALFNPSIVPHPDQSGVPAGALRFILSLRATGEGHISSITFRVGVVSAQHRITLTPPVAFATEPERVPNATYDKPLFARKLEELGVQNRSCRRVLDQLADSFTMTDLRRVLAAEGKRTASADAAADRAARGIRLLAESNYEVRFAPGQPVSQRVIFPSTPSQSNVIEDARFVRFQNDDSSFTYYATYTAYDGKIILPQLLE